MRILLALCLCALPGIANAKALVTKEAANKYNNRGGAVIQVNPNDQTQRFILYASAIPLDGRVALCGFYALSASAKPNYRRVKRQFANWNFYLGSHDLNANGSRFDQIPARFYKDGYVKTYEQQLTCRKTRVKWEAGFEELKVTVKQH